MEGEEGKKIDEDMIKELAAFMQAAGLINGSNQSQLLVKILLSAIAVLIAILIYIVEPGIKNIINNQEIYIKKTDQIQFMVEDHEKRITRLESRE